MTESHPLFAAIYDPVMAIAERTLLRSHRQALAEGIDGPVLDVGTGTGAMLPVLAAANPSAIHAIEPGPAMRRRAHARIESDDLDVSVRSASAESLPYDDDSFETVVAAMVLCTVDDPDAALAEVERVLVPGGELRLFEHVADEGWRNRVQAAIDPIWRHAAAGCHLRRATAERVLDRSALDVIAMERFHLGVTPVRPFVRGRARFG
ncbi:class I SAM-dependent methyltransferase [Halococcoides cellulosivorans]|uniref:Class I SAM-dependent methyltransferase n=1 Tax=Halococcoides cellulosivorans TaxID=1679096 RepID=A0A2R4X0B2_9EURY|nr:class I SAM-dependent methyltransferase [Halococcoides cellulosivorans]AWB27244.1 class I SAM-dependent methyltransferase [Halococcoides cellulosivorans]